MDQDSQGRFLAEGKILIADDEEGIRLSLSGRAKRLGLKVVTASDGFEAIAALKGNELDLACIDLTMPGKTGFEVIEAAQEARPELPLIVITASESIDDVVRALRARVSDYLLKPISTLVLFDMAVLRALKRSAVKRENERLLEESKRLAVIDPLTGLYNRRRVNQALSNEVERARRYGRPLSLIMLDIDGLKSINDDLGHPVGDEAIQTIAKIIKNQVRKTDLPGRIGGDEFVIVSPELDAEAAAKLAEDIVELAAERSVKERRLGVSVGVAGWRPGFNSPKSLVQSADKALYRSKRSGGSQVFVAHSNGVHRQVEHSKG